MGMRAQCDSCRRIRAEHQLPLGAAHSLACYEFLILLAIVWCFDPSGSIGKRLRKKEKVRASTYSTSVRSARTLSKWVSDSSWSSPLASRRIHPIWPPPPFSSVLLPFNRHITLDNSIESNWISIGFRFRFLSRYFPNWSNLISHSATLFCYLGLLVLIMASSSSRLTAYDMFRSGRDTVRLSRASMVDLFQSAFTNNNNNNNYNNSHGYQEDTASRIYGTSKVGFYSNHLLRSTVRHFENTWHLPRLSHL